MEDENFDYLDINEFISDVGVFLTPHELKIGRKILNDLDIDPDREDDIHLHCSSSEFQNFIARIIMTALYTKKTY
ncbi:hypothetical protein [Fontibacter flavus]|uniref:Uncharacterized protein n=1 Tax=Fontibacter flavus TaxID=654838 RepID=A0ABV6FVA4_9BACT